MRSPLSVLPLAALAIVALACSKQEEAPPAGPPASRHGPDAHDESPTPEADAAPERSPLSGPLLELSADAVRDLRLTIRRAERRPASDTVTAFGSLELDPNSLRAVSTLIAGRVGSIERTLGEPVDAGADLVVLESVALGRARAAVDASQARVAIARGRHELAVAQRDRIAELVKERLSTLRDRQSADAEAKAREADVAEAEVALRDAERALVLLGAEAGTGDSRLVLRAPSSGVVVFRDGSPGDAVEEGHVFFRVADFGSLLAVVHPFERDGARVDEAATVHLSVGAHPGRSFEATFLRAGPEVDPVARTLAVRLSVPNPEGVLRPGMSVTAEIRLAAEADQQIVTVPLAAVQRVERDWCVFIPRGPGRYERRSIARGRDLGGEVEVLSGLGAGEEIVVEGAFVLRSESTRGADTGDEHGH